MRKRGLAVNFDTRLLRHLDKLLILTMLVLIGIGIVVVSSAARGFAGIEGASSFMNKQILAAAVGFVLLLLVLLFDYSEFSRMTMIIYALNVILLMVVIAFGSEVLGGKRLSIGGFQLQPGEYGKVMIILTLGHHLAKIERLQTIWDLIMPGLHVLPPVILLLFDSDLGTALVFVAIAAAMVYMAGFPGWKLALYGGLPIVTVAGWVYAHVRWGIWQPLLDHQVWRLRVFVNPELDPSGRGYQVIQSKIAVGSGGLLGKGLYQGTQNQLGFLPEQHTDFIFSVVGEELGFIGGVVILVLFLLLLWRIMVIAGTAKDKYGALIGAGVAAMIGFHVLENVGMTLGVMPVTGIPLPFISYGGSSLMANMVAVALVLNVGMRRQKIMF